MLLEIAAGLAGDEDDLGAAGVGSEEVRMYILGAPNMSFNYHYRTRYPGPFKDLLSVAYF